MNPKSHIKTLHHVQYMRAKHRWEKDSFQFESEQRLKCNADRYYGQVAMYERHNMSSMDGTDDKLEATWRQVEALKDDLHAKQRDQSSNSKKSTNLLQAENERIRGKTRRLEAQCQYEWQLQLSLEPALAVAVQRQRKQYIRKVNRVLKDGHFDTFVTQIDAVTSGSRNDSQKAGFVERVNASLEQIFVKYPTNLHLSGDFEMMFPDNVEKRLFQNMNRTNQEPPTGMLMMERSRDAKTNHNTKENKKDERVLKDETDRFCTAELDSRDTFTSTRYSTRFWFQRTHASVASSTSPPMSVELVRRHEGKRTYSVAIWLREDNIMIGTQTVCFSEIHSLRIGDTSLFEGNPEANCCLTIVIANGTILLETASRQKMDFWVNAIKTLTTESAKRDMRKTQGHEHRASEEGELGDKTSNCIRHTI